jgi:hypothetical protein
VLNCPVTISVALESVLGSLREYSYQLFDVLSLVSVHNRKKSLKPLSMHRIQETRLHRALFFEEGVYIECIIH